MDGYIMGKYQICYSIRFLNNAHYKKQSYWVHGVLLKRFWREIESYLFCEKHVLVLESH